MLMVQTSAVEALSSDVGIPARQEARLEPEVRLIL